MRKRYVMLIVAALLLVLAFRYVLPLILPFVLAMVFSGIVKPVVSYLHQKCGWNYKVSVTAVVLFTVLALAAFGIYIGVMAVRQACVCLQQVPVYCQSVCGMMEQACESVDRVFDLQIGQSMRFGRESERLSFLLGAGRWNTGNAAICLWDHAGHVKVCSGRIYICAGFFFDTDG